MIAGIGDEGGGLGGLGLGLRAGSLRAGEGGRHIEGDAGALKREIGEEEPHPLAGDILHLGEVGVDAVDQVRLAGSGAAAPVRRAGQEGLGDAVGAARLAKPATAASSELAASGIAKCVLRAADQQVAQAEIRAWRKQLVLPLCQDRLFLVVAIAGAQHHHGGAHGRAAEGDGEARRQQ